MTTSLVQLRRPSTSFAMPFNHRDVAGKVLVTNTEGNFLLLMPDEFASFARGDVAKGTPLYQRLAERNFVRAEVDTRRMAERLRARKTFLHAGPNLHILVVTLRCNETCVYCHASRADMTATHTDMTKETAERSVELVFQSTNPSVTIEFQGGEPLVAFDVVKHVIDVAREKNKTAGKRLEFTMVSNLSLMDEEKLAYLVDNRVQICTSIDGPEHLHDKQRKLPGLSAHAKATHWIRRINDAYAKMGLDPTLYHVEALLTTTREALPRWKEIVDTYVDLGCRALFLRPVDPFGFADRTAPRVEYPRAEYLEFYRNATDYILELNKRGTEILERFAAIFLTKILGGEDPNFLDIRSPCGAGIGQIAYNYDGKVFTCDEGRMLHEMGDSTFLIGDVGTSRYRELMGHETVRALAIASNLDAQPDCVNCTYQPYCGVCPVHSHKTQGSIFGRMRESSLCAVHKGIQDYLFEKIGSADRETLEVLQRWTTLRDRTHFLQTCAT
ncbi:MAG TPA: His-Xaa-Ser system radical SAM maturase HxsB [Polyangiaceae bacterium]|jgi:His-Xaa-Ser system radical SAM maturase HxsB